MAASDDFQFLDATAQAELVRTSGASPLELVDAAIARIERLNPGLNAVITPLFEQARTTAQSSLPSGPFAGVPFVVKDLVASLGGVPMACGSAFMRGFTPDHDADIIKKYKDAGFVIVGKTNTPEFGLMATTEPSAFGPTRNPWDPDRTPGGSSGGTAAAVASGMVAVGHGNDGGGSIRIPSACCGLFGLKPTRGRNPLGPDVGDLMSGLVTEHVLARSVRDSAAILDCTHGTSMGAPYTAPPPARPYQQEVVTHPGELRIAYTTQSPNGAPVDPECVKAVENAMRLCESLGHHVVEASPEVDGDQFTQAFIALWAAGCSWTIEGLARASGRAIEEKKFEPMTWALHQMGLAVSAADYLLAVSFMQNCGRILAEFLGQHDLWVTPTLAQLPPKLGTLVSPPDNPMHGLFAAAQFVPFTPIVNATGVPAMSMPLYATIDNVPVGVHFVGRYGDEATLFRLAGQLEEACPWADRRPKVN